MIRPCRKPQRCVCLLHQLFFALSETAEFLQFTDSHHSICPYFPPLISFLLHDPHPAYPVPDLSRTLLPLLSCKRFIPDPWSFRTDIHPIQERLADLPKILLNLRRRAGTSVKVRIIPAGAGIHGTDQYEVCRKYEVPLTSCNPDLPFFQRLP